MTAADTPRTETYVLNPHPESVPAEFARELEREVEFWKSKASEAEDREGKHEAEVEELQQQMRNCLEIIDDDAKEKSELERELVSTADELKALKQRLKNYTGAIETL